MTHEFMQARKKVLSKVPGIINKLCVNEQKTTAHPQPVSTEGRSVTRGRWTRRLGREAEERGP